jgi:hypothetical protein
MLSHALPQLRPPPLRPAAQVRYPCLSARVGLVVFAALFVAVDPILTLHVEAIGLGPRPLFTVPALTGHPCALLLSAQILREHSLRERVIRLGLLLHAGDNYFGRVCP